MAVYTLQNRVIVAGGSQWKTRKSCEAFDQCSKRWNKIASLNIKRGNAAAVTDDNNMYVFGGWEEKARDAVEQYDATADKWTVLSPTMPVGRYSFAAACINSYIYLLGGMKSDCDPEEESTDCLKPDRRGFLRKALLPVPCYDLSAVSLSVSDEELWKVLLPMLELKSISHA